MKEKDMMGMLVRSVAGHDNGEYYIVIRSDEKIAFVANGRERTCDSPKRKNLKHLQPAEGEYDTSIKERLCAGEKVREEEIRKLIGNYKRENITCQKRTSSKSKAQ
jgi:ribosomal protein L14E/L6E/L27E